ncbi:MAG TPA: ATP-binding cassette domain-containing protein [Planctomycetota bacterium]|nr:ATP-binding cassette domain-containing protein [Planctomycetota bacterium]
MSSPVPPPVMTNRVEIRVEDLRKAFRGHAVLKGIDLEVPRGDLLAIVGASGCGKTVLLHHIIAHLRPDSGRVLVADHEQEGAPLVDLGKLDEEGLDHIRRHDAVVFQRNALFSATVYENIALWLREIQRMDEDAIRARVREALDAVGFRGDESVISKDRSELSGGMAKRVALARALAMRPYTVFFDEPTTGLDPINAAQIHDLIRETHDEKGPVERTTVIITHDKDLLLRLAPRVVMLHEGRVHFDGPYTEFEESDLPAVRPYLEAMPSLHHDMTRAVAT